MEQLHCPQCDAPVGSSEDEVGISCWKCGLEFGDEEGTEPIVRDKTWTARTWLPAVLWLGAVLAPGVLYWVLIRGFAAVRSRVPSIGVLWIFPAAGLALFGFGCTFYALDRLHKADRNFAWLIKAALSLLIFLANFILLSAAIAAIP